MKRTPALLAVLLIVSAVVGWRLLFPGNDAPAEARPSGTALVTAVMPQTLSEAETIGQRVFNARCAACHGAGGVGVDGFGPPLIHKIYEPSHHGDMAFLMAVRNGVRAHHWRFGDMPPQDGLTDADVAAIVAFIRRVQRANGIS